eukprot:509330-Pyramimonas_sp.AAC.1
MPPGHITAAPKSAPSTGSRDQTQPFVDEPPLRCSELAAQQTDVETPQPAVRSIRSRMSNVGADRDGGTTASSSTNGKIERPVRPSRVGSSRPGLQQPRPNNTFGGNMPRWGAAARAAVDNKKLVHAKRTVFDDLPLEPALFPVSEPGRENLNWEVGKWKFRADFDSANLANAQKGQSDREFELFTNPDNGGTEFETGHRTWFYFGLSGMAKGEI